MAIIAISSIRDGITILASKAKLSLNRNLVRWKSGTLNTHIKLPKLMNTGRFIPGIIANYMILAGI
jgi:hypothetical protein